MEIHKVKIHPDDKHAGSFKKWQDRLIVYQHRAFLGQEKPSFLKKIDVNKVHSQNKLHMKLKMV